MVSNIRVAEAAKVIENAQRDLNIAFVNELSIIFRYMGLDTSEVLEAAGTKWNFLPFKPGLVGGHCIGVDPYYLTFKAQQLGYKPQVILSGRSINDEMGRYTAQTIIRLMIKSGINVARATVAVLGITFKENVPDVRNSKVFDLIRELKDWGVVVIVVDPWASRVDTRERYNLELSQLSPGIKVDSIVIAVGHRQFVDITPAELREMCSHIKRPVIADLKAIHSRQLLEQQGFEVFQL
jgi:UDP-N-acetyl-D-galactosamine dehydrogenase